MNYQDPISPVPMQLQVNGETYVLASQGQQTQAVELYQPPQQVALPPGAIRLNGEIHTRTATGYQPYSPNPPAWLNHPYTKGSGLLVAAGIYGTVLVCLAIGAIAVVTVVMAHALAVGVAFIAVLLGGMVFLKQLTTVKHGHAPPRQY
jgi:hypothetical protein